MPMDWTQVWLLLGVALAAGLAGAGAQALSRRLRRARFGVPLSSAAMLNVLRQTDHLVVLTDASRRITWVNAAFERVTEYTLAEALGHNPGHLLQCEATDALTVDRIRQALAGGEGFNGEILNRSKSGRLYWLELDIHPLREPDGRLSGFAAVENDITARKLAESALRANESFLDNAGRIAGVGGVSYDLLTRTLQCTSQTVRMLGMPYGHQPAVGELLALLEPPGRAQIDAAIAAAPCNPALRGTDCGGASQVNWDFELPMRTADGRAIWVRLVAETQYDDTGPVRIVGAAQDTTARRQIEAEARRNSELLRGAIDTIDEAFVVYDADDRLVFCNDKYRQIYAATADLIVPGNSFEQIIRGGAERGQYQAAIGRVEQWVAERLELHRQAAGPLVQRLDDGRVVRIVERRTPDGHTVGFRIDITDLVRATEAAEAANRAKTEFIGTISHELRTPLQSVIGFSTLGQHFAQADPQLKSMFDDIHAGGQRMLRLVNALLDVSKIDGTLGSMARRRCDLSALVAEVAHELQPLAEARRIALALPNPRPEVIVEGDAFRLQQVVRNVLANALRFSPEGGTIEIGLADRGALGRLLTVRDHGPGIPADELESIFDAFVQSSRTRDGSGGTGLGLTICRKILGAHGGRITAENADGGGACMRIWLPPPEHREAIAAPAAAPAAADAPRPALQPSAAPAGAPMAAAFRTPDPEPEPAP